MMEQFTELFPGFLRPEPVSPFRPIVLQNTDIPREYDPPVSFCYPEYLLIVEIASVESIKTHKPQKSHELSKMYVEDEPGFSLNLWTEMEKVRSADFFQNRVYQDSISIAERVREIDRSVVQEDDIHLRVGNTQAFNCVLNRKSSIEFVGEEIALCLVREKIFQITMESDPRSCGHTEFSPSHLLFQLL